jgi:hypothetical protein
MRLRQYITELTMSKNTKIEKRGVRAWMKMEEWRITLENGNYYDLTVADRSENWTPLFVFRKLGLKFDPDEYAKNDEIFDQGKGPRWMEIDFEDESGEMISIKKSPQEALQLFAAIEYWFKGWMKDENPEGIVFDSTGEVSKNKLYSKLAKRITKFGYIDLREFAGIEEYWLVRKDFKPWFAGGGRYVT